MSADVALSSDGHPPDLHRHGSPGRHTNACVLAAYGQAAAAGRSGAVAAAVAALWPSSRRGRGGGQTRCLCDASPGWLPVRLPEHVGSLPSWRHQHRNPWRRSDCAVLLTPRCLQVRAPVYLRCLSSCCRGIPSGSRPYCSRAHAQLCSILVPQCQHVCPLPQLPPPRSKLGPPRRRCPLLVCPQGIV